MKQTMKVAWLTLYHLDYRLALLTDINIDIDMIYIIVPPCFESTHSGQRHNCGLHVQVSSRRLSLPFANTNLFGHSCAHINVFSDST